MTPILAWLIKVFGPTVVTVEQEVETDAVKIATNLASAFNGIILNQPADQQKILHDSLAQFAADRAAGKTFGEAAADAATKFWNSEVTEFTEATKLLFDAGIKATESAQ